MISKQRLEEIINEYQDSDLSGLADDILREINGDEEVLLEGVYENKQIRVVYNHETSNDYASLNLQVYDFDEYLYLLSESDKKLNPTEEEHLSQKDVNEESNNKLTYQLDGFAAKALAHLIKENTK